jgi:hypothetical protein
MSIVSGTIAGISGANATESAAQKSADSQRYAADIADKNYQQTRSDFMPYYNVGKEAIPTYQKMLSGDYDMQESPAAKYQLEKGTKALNRSLASRGLSGSGNAVNRLTELNSSVAASDWNNQYSRILDALKLGSGASSSMGNAATTNTNAATTTANSLSNIYTNQGNNQASLYAGLGGQTSNAAALGIKGYQAYNAAAPATAGTVDGLEYMAIM